MRGADISGSNFHECSLVGTTMIGVKVTENTRLRLCDFLWTSVDPTTEFLQACGFTLPAVGTGDDNA